MAQVTGVVEAVTNKWEKFNVLVNGQWYSTKLEWKPNPEPQKGDTIEFESGATGKYLQKVRIVSGGAAPTAGGGNAPAKGNFGGNSNLVGIAVGAAMNQAVNIESARMVAENDGNFVIANVEVDAKSLYELAERLKSQAAAGDITQSAEEREAAEAALRSITSSAPDPELNREFA